MLKKECFEELHLVTEFGYIVCIYESQNLFLFLSVTIKVIYNHT